MAIEDAWVLSEHLRTGTLDSDTTLAAYNAVRPQHCRRVQALRAPAASSGISPAPNGRHATT